MRALTGNPLKLHPVGIAAVLKLIVQSAIFAMCATLSLAQSAPPSRSAVIAELQNGDNSAALRLVQQALLSAPHDCALLSLEGIAQTRLQQTETALHTFRSAFTHCPNYLPALEGAAQIEYARQGADTVPLLKRIVAVKPQDPTAHAMLATTLRRQGKCQEALADYEASSALFPGQPALQQEYGSCLVDTGDIKAALVQYQELLQSHPQDAIRFDVAILQWKSHANDEALETLAPLLSGGHATRALSLAATIHEGKGETPQAVHLLRQAILQSPDEPENYIDFAAIALAHSSYQVGIDMLNAGLKRLPEAATLYLARGVLEVQLSNSDAAVADFEQAHRLDPKLSLVVDAVGIMKSQQHRDSESLALFEAQAKQHPRDPLLQYLLAEQLSETSAGASSERLYEAISAAKRAVALDPSYVAAHDLLAVLYLRAEQPELAMREAEAALKLDPADQNALYQKLQACRRSGDRHQIQALTARFVAVRKKNQLNQQATDRYRLQEPGSEVDSAH